MGSTKLNSDKRGTYSPCLEKIFRRANKKARQNNLPGLVFLLT